MYENVPINQRPDYLEHLNKVEEYEDYLVGILGFEKILNKWCSYEFTTIFERNNIEIRIVYHTSTPSSIELVNTNKPYDESKRLSNVEYSNVFSSDTFEEIKNRLTELE